VSYKFNTFARLFIIGLLIFPSPVYASVTTETETFDGTNGALVTDLTVPSGSLAVDSDDVSTRNDQNCCGIGGQYFFSLKDNYIGDEQATSYTFTLPDDHDITEIGFRMSGVNYAYTIQYNYSNDTNETSNHNAQSGSSYEDITKTVTGKYIVSFVVTVSDWVGIDTIYWKYDSTPPTTTTTTTTTTTLSPLDIERNNNFVETGVLETNDEREVREYHNALDWERDNNQAETGHWELDSERRDREAREAEEERLRIEEERLEAERLEEERLESERIEAERLEKERLEKERLRIEEEARLEEERLALIKAEKEAEIKAELEVALELEVELGEEELEELVEAIQEIEENIEELEELAEQVEEEVIEIKEVDVEDIIIEEEEKEVIEIIEDFPDEEVEEKIEIEIIAEEIPEIPTEIIEELTKEEIEEIIEEFVEGLETEEVIEILEVVEIEEVTEEQIVMVQAVVEEAVENIEELTEEQIGVVAEVLQVETGDVEIIAEAIQEDEIMAEAMEVYVERAVENKGVENYTFADVVTEVQFEGFLEDPLKPFIDIDLAGISIENIGDDMTNDQKEKSQEVVVPVILTRIASISAFAFRRKIW